MRDSRRKYQKPTEKPEVKTSGCGCGCGAPEYEEEDFIIEEEN